MSLLDILTVDYSVEKFSIVEYSFGDHNVAELGR